MNSPPQMFNYEITFSSLPRASLQDEQSAMLMLKRHMILKQGVDDYADSIQTLAERAQKMFAEDHPDGFAHSDQMIFRLCAGSKFLMLSQSLVVGGDENDEHYKHLLKTFFFFCVHCAVRRSSGVRAR